MKFSDSIRFIRKQSEAALTKGSDTLNELKKSARAHQPAISRRIDDAVLVAGKAIKEAGTALARRTEANSAAHDDLTPLDTGTARAAYNAKGYAISALGAGAKLAVRLGASTERAAPIIGAVAGGAMTGVAGTVSSLADSVAITERRFEQIHQRIRTASPPVKAEIDRKTAQILRAQSENRRKDLLDILVVGGVSLASILADPAQTPAKIEEAFRLAYPGLAGGGETFGEAAARIPTEDLVGLVSGVKGKLFEVELVDHLNGGNLQDGLQAQLAGSATQTGHDIQIVDEHGQVVDLLQAKATDSVSYVQEALERYPGIDVTTTSEVYAQLLAREATEFVSNSGMSEIALEAQVENALASGDWSATDLIPSTLGLAIIGMSTFMDGSLTLEQRGAEFGDRAAKASVAGAAVAVALIASNTWWLALAAGVGSRSLMSHGGNKRERYEVLETVAETLEERANALSSTPVFRPA